MRGRFWGPLAIAIALASMTAGGIVITQSDAESAVANIWVGASGSCEDLGLLDYDPSRSCGTVDAANDTCEGGDLIRVVTGKTLGTVATVGSTVEDGPARTTPCVVKGENDGDPISVIGGLYLSGSLTDFTIHNPTWTTSNQTNNAVDDYQVLKIETTGNDITVYNPDSSTFEGFGCADRCKVIGGDIGPCIADKNGPNCVPSIRGNPSVSNGWTLKDLDIHGQVAIENTIENCGSDSCHTDGMAIFGGQNILLDGVSWYNNVVTHIRIQDFANLGINNITIQNNRFGPVTNHWKSVGDVWSYYNNNAIDWDNPGGDELPGVIVRFNSFYMYPGSCPSGQSACGMYATPAGTPSSPANYYGNIVSPPSGCGTNYTMTYNVFRAWNEFNGCTGAGATNSYLAYTTAIPYASMPAWNSTDPAAGPPPGEPDFHITGSTWDGDQKVPASLCDDVPLDADGNARGAGGTACDAGAYER
jgi:hypothetical protein